MLKHAAWKQRPDSAPEKKDHHKSTLIVFLLTVFVLGGTFLGVRYYLYRVEHDVAMPKGEPVLICIPPDDTAAEAAAEYLAYAISRKVGAEAEILKEKTEDAKAIRILYEKELPEGTKHKPFRFFTSAAIPANSGEAEEYSVRFDASGLSILVSDREHCFGAVKAITDRWLKEDCGLKKNSRLVISHDMIARKLIGLDTTVSGEIKLLTQNLRNADDGEGRTVEERAERFFRLVEDYQPDLIGTQECTRKWLQLLQENLSDRYEIFGCSRLGPNEEDGERNVILYRKSRFVFLDGETFWLSNTPTDAVTKLNYEGSPRICTWGLFHDSETGKDFLFSNTHLYHPVTDYAAEVRARQAEILLWHLRKGDMFATYPGFLTGDFNGESYEAFYFQVTPYYHDARFTAISNSSSVDYSFNNYGRSQALIDYCFHSPDNVTILDYRILDDQYGDYISDHYGILVTAIVY